MKPISLAGIAAAAIAAAFFAVALMQPKHREPVSAPAEQNLFSFIRSLDGTRPDGNLQEDPADRLVVNAELVLLFDYYLTAVGEKSLDEIRHEIERELDGRLKPRAALEAKNLLARYLAYKQALVEVEKNPRIAGGTIDAMRGRLTAMQQARAQFFSAAEIDAMFALEDALHLDAVARLELSQDKSLSAAQQAERLAALDAALPPPLREARDASLQIVKLEESANRLRSKGASEDEVYRMRAAALSPEAAARMAEVDREDIEWKQRIDAYLAERKRLLDATTNQLPADQEIALQQLRQARFSEDEQRRLGAYE